MKQLIILPALMLLSACGGQEAETPIKEGGSPAATSSDPDSPSTEPMGEAEIKEFADDFEAAMQAVPPELRADFQKYLTCEIETNNARPVDQQIQIDASHIRSMTAKLKADPSLASC